MLTLARTSEHLRRAFSLDLRSLGACRWALGLLTIAELFERRPWLAALYGPDGVFPTAAHTASRYRGFPSVFALSERASVVEGVWWLALIAAISFAIGLRARWSALAAFYFVTCLDERNVFVTFGPHTLERVFLFWCAFVPCGARFSLIPVPRTDASTTRRTDSVEGASAFAFIAQLSIVYISAAWGKLATPQWLEGRGVIEAILIDPSPGPLGRWLLTAPSVCRAATFATLALELAMPLALFVKRLRGPLVVSFLIFHFGLGLSLTLGLFPAFSGAVWLALVPFSFWDLLEPATQPTGPRNTPLLERLGSRMAILALLSVTAATVADLQERAPRQLLWPARALGLLQSWSFYAGEGDGTATWVVPRATTSEGRIVDGWSLRRYDPSLEASGARSYLVEAWLDNLLPPGAVGRRETTARWICARGGISTVEVVQVSQRRFLTGGGPLESVVIETHLCP